MFNASKKNNIPNITAIQINLYLSRINEKVYIAIDGNLVDIEHFGISANSFQEISKKIDDLFQKELIN